MGRAPLSGVELLRLATDGNCAIVGRWIALFLEIAVSLCIISRHLP
jgi:hypothetical protein